MRISRLFFAALVLTASLATARAQAPKAGPTVWMHPPGQERQGVSWLFERPDDWKDTRALVDVLFCSDLTYKRDFTDEELTRWFAQARDWKPKI